MELGSTELGSTWARNQVLLRAETNLDAVT